MTASTSTTAARPRGRKPAATISDPRSARQRLLDAANELFYAEGVQSVGIERIIEHAGVAKGSLYNTFGSKAALVHAYLEARHAGTTGRLTEAIAAAHSPQQKLLAVFDAQAHVIAQPGFRGCAFMAASAEAPPGSVIDRDASEFRAWIRTMFTRLAEDTGAQDPQTLGRQLHLIYDGVGIAARMDRDLTIAIAARAAAAALIGASLPARGRRDSRN